MGGGNSSSSKQKQAAHRYTLQTASDLDDLAISQVKSRTGDQIFDLWDFAGDEHHNVAHSYFVSGRSVYLIVFNSAEPLEAQYHSLDYWMAAISARARGCPVILVGTHQDEKACSSKTYRNQVLTQLEARYAARFPDLKRVVICSTRTGKNVSKVMDAVSESLAKMSCMGQQLPDVFEAYVYFRSSHTYTRTRTS